MFSNSLFPGFWRSFSLWALVCALCAPLAGFAQVAPYSFSPQTGVAPGTPFITSNAIKVSGTTPSYSISIVGGEYSIGGGAFTSAPGVVSNCQTVTVRVPASSSFGATTTATLNVGGVTGVFSVTTAAADTAPNAFTFAAQTGVALSTPTLSNSITVNGTNTGSPISVSGGEYRINAGAFTAAGGVVNSGDTVVVRVTSAATYATTRQATLAIGGVSGTFTVTTLADPTSALTLSPTTLSFQQPALGSPGAPRSATVTNTGAAAVAISAVGVVGAAASDYSRTHTCGTSLAGGASCTVSVVFTPSAAGVRLAEIALTTSPSTPGRIGLIGNRNAGVATNDVNGDGRSDVIWRNTATGNVVVWPMNGFAATGGALMVSTASDLNWAVAGSGDFNGDGRSDILWRNAATRDVIVWLMNGSAVQTGALVNRMSRGWQIAGTGDFNGDGHADILLRNRRTGANSIWLMNGVTRQAVASITAADSGWQVAGTGDFNGDGKSDILWRHSTSGDVVAWLMNGSVRQSGALVNTVGDMNWQIAGTGDFNGDGKSDILWRHRATGNNQVWLMDGVTLQRNALVNAVADLNWVVEGTGDYNGDGKSDILWRHRATGNNQVWLMDGSTVSSTGNLPTIADMAWTVAP